jgi:hypothetical protein
MPLRSKKGLAQQKGRLGEVKADRMVRGNISETITLLRNMSASPKL